VRTYATRFSIYEVDEDEKKIRRLVSEHEATPRQGADGEWKQFYRIDHTDAGLLIHWDDQGRCTLTSEVVGMAVF
jgi:hypothetical protein